MNTRRHIRKRTPARAKPRIDTVTGADAHTEVWTGMSATKIIVPPTRRVTERARRYTCHECGCVFDSLDSNAVPVIDDSLPERSTLCPECLSVCSTRDEGRPVVVEKTPRCGGELEHA